MISKGLALTILGLFHLFSRRTLAEASEQGEGERVAKEATLVSAYGRPFARAQSPGLRVSVASKVALCAPLASSGKAGVGRQPLPGKRVRAGVRGPFVAGESRMCRNFAPASAPTDIHFSPATVALPASRARVSGEAQCFSCTERFAHWDGAMKAISNLYPWICIALLPFHLV